MDGGVQDGDEKGTTHLKKNCHWSNPLLQFSSKGTPLTIACRLDRRKLASLVHYCDKALAGTQAVMRFLR